MRFFTTVCSGEKYAITRITFKRNRKRWTDRGKTNLLQNIQKACMGPWVESKSNLSFIKNAKYSCRDGLIKNS